VFYKVSESVVAAAVDVGTNSTRLLIAEISETGTVIPLHSDLVSTRIGQQMLQGLLLESAMERTLAVINNFVNRAREQGAQKIILAATSAVRDAANQRYFADLVHSATGLELNILSGTEEAYLSYWGVTNSWGDIPRALVIDIGGGSTEFIWATQEENRFVSVDLGAVRLTEGGFGKERMRVIAEELLAETLLAIKSKSCPEEIIGVGGTITTLSAMALELAVYDREKVHGYRLTRAKTDEFLELLHRLTIEERIKLPGLAPQRASIIPAGACILSAIFHGLAKDSLLASEADLLYGLILKITS